jgi:uncharacterized damage-inducible protein DinB
MSINLSIDELRAYTDEEREKWSAWFRGQPCGVFDTALQSRGAFPTVWHLLDHIFVVERRHLQRLRGEYPLPETTAVASGDWETIWQYGLQTRAELLALIGSLSPAEVDTPRAVPIMGEQRMITPRKILFHVFVHELRHWAQISLALRNAGSNPPQDQDFIFSTAMA